MQVDFLPAKAMTPEELEAQQKRIAELAKATRVVEFELDGTTARYELFFVHSYPTNGGMMYDLTITYEEQETRHRIILGKSTMRILAWSQNMWWQWHLRSCCRKRSQDILKVLSHSCIPSTSNAPHKTYKSQTLFQQIVCMSCILKHDV